jgi:hypothetical protein
MWDPPDETQDTTETSDWSPPTGVLYNEYAVSDTQYRAVTAYCEELLDPEVAAGTAADVVAAFGENLAALEADDVPVEERNAYLLSMTRLLAAVSLPDRSSPAERRRAVLASMGADSQCSCREASMLLASHANGNIEPHEQVALEQHLYECEDCRYLTETMDRAADRFYAIIEPRRGGGMLGPRNLAVYSTAALGLLVAGAVVLLSSGGTSAPPTQAFVPSVTTPIVTTTTVARHVTHHHAAKHHKTVKHVATPPPATDVANTVTPVDTKPVVSTPPASTSTPSTSSSALPATTGPQTGIGSIGGG